MSALLGPEESRRFSALRSEAERLGRQVDIYLGVYPGVSTIRNKQEARSAMERLDAILLEVQDIVAKHKDTESNA